MRRLTILLLLVLTAFRVAAQQEKKGFTNLGPQITAGMIQGSLFVKDASGKLLLYTVVRGEPAHLLGYDATTKELILDEPLPKSDGAWDMTFSSDGWLYVPGASGFLFRHKPGTKTVENLGLVLPGETYVWNLTAGKDGEVFGATYPGCRVFSFKPGKGFTDVGKGPLTEGENYVRSLAYYPRTNKLYAGVGSHAHLVELDPVTGAKKELLPEKYDDKEFVYGLEIVTGKKGGDRLLCLLTRGSSVLVYNLKTGKFEQEIMEMDLKTVAPEARGNRVFYTAKEQLWQADLHKKTFTPTQIGATGGSANAMYWTENDELYILTAMANFVSYNKRNGKLSTQKLKIPRQPIPINAIMLGPDQKVWMGGYLAGGHATFDPVTGKTTELEGLDQTEGMAVQGNKIYFGIYPKGRFYVYDTRQAWDKQKDNPRFLGQIHDQSRSFAVLSLEAQQKMIFGMVPEYGMLGGHLVEYDVVKDTLISFGEVIPKHSIVSLLKDGNNVLGATSVSGGLGVKPSEPEAKLFGWDVKQQKKTFEYVPVQGAMAITGLINGPGRKIWGVADGTLFLFDPVTKQITGTKKLFDVPPVRSHVWRSVFLSVHPNGMVYGTGNNQLFRIDPVSMEVTYLDGNASLMVMDRTGIIYFRRGTELIRYDPSVEKLN